MDKPIEYEIFVAINRQFKIRLKVLVDLLISKGFRKGEAYAVIKYKLTVPIVNPINSKEWAAPMLELQEEYFQGRLSKVVRLKEEWYGVDEKYALQFFTGRNDGVFSYFN